MQEFGGHKETFSVYPGQVGAIEGSEQRVVTGLTCSRAPSDVCGENRLGGKGQSGWEPWRVQSRGGRVGRSQENKQQMIALAFQTRVVANKMARSR